MKYLRQFGIILAVTCAGEIMKYFIPLAIPGSIYGLILMFVLLLARVIKVEHVKETGEFLIEIMPLMFIPAGAGLIYVYSYDRHRKGYGFPDFQKKGEKVRWTI